MIIAIDGPAGAGKGTVARGIALHYNLAHLETGLLYRALASKVLENNVDLDDIDKIAALASTISLDDLKNKHLRSEEIGNLASKVAALPEVRQALLDFQHKFANTPQPGFNGVVLDGRDIGTLVCPQADIKFYITAELEVRAQRRLKELQERGIKSIHTAIIQNMMDRDLRDKSRQQAPLQVAKDAYVIDSSHLSPDDVLKQSITVIERHLKK
ncbi:hypothetical protein IM40_04455 [Candidatus Paracaedimonas acanthamoebae]|nr:hypothetical protein IM40_04455 [Candidatus Paracaedimonas acanthamoebae]